MTSRFAPSSYGTDVAAWPASPRSLVPAEPQFTGHSKRSASASNLVEFPDTRIANGLTQDHVEIDPGNVRKGENLSLNTGCLRQDAGRTHQELVVVPPCLRISLSISSRMLWLVEDPHCLARFAAALSICAVATAFPMPAARISPLATAMICCLFITSLPEFGKGSRQAATGDLTTERT